MITLRSSVMAQVRVIIEPSGNIVTKDVDIKSFDAVLASGFYELVLLQGDKESVKIEADDNLQYLFSVSNNGSTLVIDMPKLKNQNIHFENQTAKQARRLKVYVTFKRLKTLDVNVVGNVHSETPLKFDVLEIDNKNIGNINLQLTATSLNVKNTGIGNLTLSGNVKDATITNAGVGQFDGEDLIVETMDINNSGVGSANVNVEKDLKIRDSFLGKVRNKGNAKIHKMDGVVI